MKNVSYGILTIIMLILFCGNVYAAGEYKVDDNFYDNIRDAVAAAKTSTTHEIVLQSDLETLNSSLSDHGKETTIQLNATDTVILNLNNHKLYNTNKTNNDIAFFYVRNSGNLTIKNGTLEYDYDDVVNNETGTLNYDNVTFKVTTVGEQLINNKGNFYIKNSTIVTDASEGIALVNQATGKITIDNSTFNVGNIFTNKGDFIINSGNFTVKSNLYDDNYGTLTINGGTFNYTLASSAIVKLRSNSSVIINDGTFNSKGYLFQFFQPTDVSLTINGGNFISEKAGIYNIDVQKNKAKFVMNGGTVLAKNDYDFSNIDTYINGGSIKSTEGNIILSGSKFIVGKDDGNVNGNVPVIELPNGYIKVLVNNAPMEFYDGKIISLSSDLSKYVVASSGSETDNVRNVIIKVPSGYYVKYDKNNNNSYTAYLVKNEEQPSVEPNDEVVPNTPVNPEVTPTPTVTPDVTSPIETPAETTTPTPDKVEVENPNTGVYYGLSLLVIVTVFSGLFYSLIFKKNKFPQA